MIWNRLNHLSRDENWGDPERMNGVALLVLDTIRDRFGCRFIIHCGYEGDGHTPSSEHYKGNAIDFHIDTDDPFHRQIDKIENIIADLQLHIGLGIYPDWNRPGFHLDTRGYHARWGRIGEYVEFSKAYEYAIAIYRGKV